MSSPNAELHDSMTLHTFMEKYVWTTRKHCAFLAFSIPCFMQSSPLSFVIYLCVLKRWKRSWLCVAVSCSAWKPLRSPSCIFWCTPLQQGAPYDSWRPHLVRVRSSGSRWGREIRWINNSETWQGLFSLSTIVTCTVSRPIVAWNPSFCNTNWFKRNNSYRNYYKILALLIPSYVLMTCFLPLNTELTRGLSSS